MSELSLERWIGPALTLLGIIVALALAPDTARARAWSWSKTMVMTVFILFQAYAVITFVLKDTQPGRAEILSVISSTIALFIWLAYGYAIIRMKIYGK